MSGLAGIQFVTFFDCWHCGFCPDAMASNVLKPGAFLVACVHKPVPNVVRPFVLKRSRFYLAKIVPSEMLLVV
jgi:hypothetical protein